ncbi:cysteine--1-D-myo-inosityl 2-amino-2-deoxy-alpha-D-glucopyranoside ligase [Quadrisphaera setariae]|uniref:L-cysteine:1D-myo-inositol 2-amino-2-deoxy-alpha-D-glucopyranoside ligase n=1 Tax=Quadrisphaera setariae TaxID=2593304 RepID=A0A5C8ZGE9_9ACTN|nr:cysteine--1-D-myo-inosityl 2-amino-2-deoxy-alpha-D-glucopyranoside ligase [Quadrisphaera setariae]TXR56624.1 cysteine--1-D-myo-inosityl 2-amino-2-deoxy-alpha-D-glucopyranoside ligase [Quadrisphaera setariae]
MRPWSAPAVPQLPGRGGPVRVHDTSTGELQVAAPGPKARLYVCGITPYDATHLGHAATYLAFDLLQRAWRDSGLQVRYAQNVTDVDDPLLERATRDGVDWRELAASQVDLFASDMEALRVLPPDAWVGAVEAIPRIAATVRAMLARGAAYTVEPSTESPAQVDPAKGDVYADLSADPGFGAVAHLATEQMLALSAERGGDPQRPGKRDPLDPLLWRAAREGEPAWDGGTLGAGRPGWHVECTVIAADDLGSGFDVQGGGSDLAFPHHEMSASHGAVLYGPPFAGVYAHAGMVGLDGEKMSKSKGNLVLVSKLRAAGVEPAAVRLAVLAHHYRSDWSWTQAGLEEAVERLVRWRAAVAVGGADDGADQLAVLADLRARLADDLDAPGALVVLDAWAATVLAAPGGAESGQRADLVADAVDALLGIAL